MWGNAMKAKVNLQLLKTTTFDSGALGMLAMVIHQFRSAGRYRAQISHHGRKSTDIEFDVDEKSEVMQLDIDLAQTSKTRPEDCDCEPSKQAERTVSPKGYVLFHASSGAGYSVAVSNAEGKLIFDSAKLSDGDLFAITMLEPATYPMKNTVGSATGEIVVSLKPEIAKKIKSLETAYIDVTENKFNPERIEVTSSQGLVFRIKGSARILIEKKPDPASKRDKPAIRWQKLPTVKKP